MQNSKNKLPVINPHDPSMRAYIYYENAIMQNKIYMHNKYIAEVQEELKLKMQIEKRLQEIIQQ